MMLAQAFRRLLHGIRQSLTGLSLSLYTPLSNLSHPQPPVNKPRRTQPRTKNSRHLCLGTFNAQSIGSQRKQHETLPRDLSTYKIDILGIQETCIAFQSDQKTGTYHLLTLPCSNRWQGLGFAISPHLHRFLHKYWAQSDRVGVLQLRLPKAQRVNIVNAYAPHSGYPVAAIDSFYADLSTALSKLPQRDTTIILGDFNAKIGQRRENESFLVKWGRGRRNRNGHTLASLCDANDLFITNTAFRKRARNITIWTFRLKDHCIFNQIDYIICSYRTKKLCYNAQSWGSTLTPSDHKLVTLDFDLRALRGLRRRHEQAHSGETETRLATHLLVRDSKYRTMYRQLLEKNLADLPEHRTTTDQHWTITLNSALEAAADSVGYMPLINHTKVVDPELSRLSYEQRQLRQLIYNDHKQEVKALRTKRNRLLHQIQERSKALARALIDEKLAIIEQSNRSTQVFEATRALFRRRSPITSLCDSTGKYILNPITASELDRAFRRLRNGRATSPDSIPAELLKYGSELLAQPLADIINQGLTPGDNIHLGDGILLGLPKSNKPAGQCASLRPIVLLNSVRKAFSFVVLRRTSPKVEQFLSPHQRGFSPCRSTADAVWAHRWIAARAQRYKDRFHILGIGLPRAFDTVNRDKLLSVLKPLLDDDELRLIRLLLRDTMLSLRLGNRLLSPFESNAGTPQGDSLSPVLFVVYLEEALRDLASQLDVPHDLLADMIVYDPRTVVGVDNWLDGRLVETKSRERSGFFISALIVKYK
ncbi:Craniofacial development protein 2 [Phytophthora citrophthora]|uniref:Craniofacial development protein 2 n=1 Tax=Phytophthora citrophthora TaxID=4793 RepID=A0AAD9GYB3_9STRA|nr:Craniofacial development protein 2 [Phytophthora citrophthora]